MPRRRRDRTYPGNTSSDFADEYRDMSRLSKALSGLSSPVPKEELPELAAKARAGDKAAVQRLLGSVSRMILREAMRAHRINLENSVMDYFQEATIYLMRNGIPKYDPSISRWSTYASWWIRAGIMKLTRTGRLLGRKSSGDSSRVRERLEREGITEQEFWEKQRYISLSSPVMTHEADSPLLVDTVADTTDPSDYMEADALLVHARAISWILANGGLNPTQIVVYAEHARGGFTLAETAKKLGFSRERARQVFMRACIVIKGALSSGSAFSKSLPKPEYCARAGCASPLVPDEDYSGFCATCWEGITKLAYNKKKKKAERAIKSG